MGLAHRCLCVHSLRHSNACLSLTAANDNDGSASPDTFSGGGQQLRRPGDSKSLSETIVRIQ